MSELKPCPFCGSEASDYNHFTNCTNDDCPESKVHTKHSVWNIRPIEDKQAAETKRIRTYALKCRQLLRVYQMGKNPWGADWKELEDLEQALKGQNDGT